MEEDIKILESYLEAMKDVPVGDNVCILWAIEKVLKRLEQLEKENERLEQIERENITLGNKVEYVEENYIPKSVIREYKDKFIEDSKNETVFMTQSTQINASLISFCNELLGGSNE